MAIRSEIPERTPIENVEVEYEKVGGPKRSMKPGFNRVRLLDIDENVLELATREGFQKKDKLELAMHVKGVKDFLTVEGEVAQSVRITVFKQPAWGVALKIGKLTEEQAVKFNWARDQLAPRRRGPVRRSDEPDSDTNGAPAAPAAAASPAATATAEKPAAAAPATAPRVRPGPAKRPVALLELIGALDKLDISTDLILAVIEATEAGMAVEALYSDAGPDEAEEPAAAEPAPPTSMPAEGTARPLPVYRLASNTKLHFSEGSLPAGPAVELIYLSRLKSPERCFAVVLETDNMVQPGWPHFRKGSILLFSTVEKVESGDFAFIRSRNNDEFAQVFWDKGDELRVRALNPEVPERVIRRMEVRGIYKLIGQYIEMCGPS